MGTSSHTRIGVVLVIAMFCVSSGATCIRNTTKQESLTPLLFATPPTVQQLVDAINRSRGIQQLQSTTVSVRQKVSLSGNLVWERPANFRLRGGLGSLLGTSLDIGSNSDHFWMAIQQDLLYANHAEFNQQLNRQQIPVSPLWLIEAMGVVEIDPYSLVRQPQSRADGMLELTAMGSSGDGNLLRTIIVDPKYGLVKQVLLRDGTGRLLASSLMSQHRYYDSVQYSLPHYVQVQLVPNGSPPIDLVIQIGQYSINALEGSEPGRYQMPDLRGYNAINLVQLNMGSTQAVTPPGSLPPPPGTPAVSYRGFESPPILR